MKVNSKVIFESSGFLIKLTVLVSVLLLLQGHNNPGGGFIGGLTFICAYTLMKINIHETYLIERVWVRKCALVLGIFMLAFSLIYPVFFQSPLLKGHWYGAVINGMTLKIGTPLVFDIGVYLVVAISISFIVDTLERTWF